VPPRRRRPARTDVECATCGARGRLAPDLTVTWTDLSASVISMDEKRAHAAEIQETASRHAALRAEIEDRAASSTPTTPPSARNAPPPPDRSRPSVTRGLPSGRPRPRVHDHVQKAVLCARNCHDHGMALRRRGVQRWRPGGRVRGAARRAGVTVAVVPGGTSRSRAPSTGRAATRTPRWGRTGWWCLAVAEVIPLPGRGRTSKVRYPGEAGRSPAT
jgi:hypothetical protein